jgi:hypothetical protein
MRNFVLYIHLNHGSFCFVSGTIFFFCFFLSFLFSLFQPVGLRESLSLVCVGVKLEGKKKETPHPVHYRPIFGGPRVKRPTTAARKGLRKTKAERENENERRKKGRFILSFSLLRGRLDRSRGRQNNS